MPNTTLPSDMTSRLATSSAVCTGFSIAISSTDRHQFHARRLGRQPRQQRQALQRLVGRRQVVMPGRQRVEPGLRASRACSTASRKRRTGSSRARLLHVDEHAEFHSLPPLRNRAQ